MKQFELEAIRAQETQSASYLPLSYTFHLMNRKMKKTSCCNFNSLHFKGGTSESGKWEFYDVTMGSNLLATALPGRCLMLFLPFFFSSMHTVICAKHFFYLQFAANNRLKFPRASKARFSLVLASLACPAVNSA